jgi:hypothetical protein
MRNITPEAMTFASALMLFIVPWARTSPTLTKRLIGGISCAAVVALAMSDLFLNLPIMMDITKTQQVVIAGGAFILLLVAIIWNFRRGFGNHHQNKTVVNCR